MTRQRPQWTSALGTLVCGAFLLGLATAPVRSCLHHPFDGGTEHAPGSAHHGAAHGASNTASDTSDTTAEGCECLGLCQAEHAPLVSTLSGGAAAPNPAPRSLTRVAGVAEPRLLLRYAAPLARPPPLSV